MGNTAILSVKKDLDCLKCNQKNDIIFSVVDFCFDELPV